MKCIFFCILLLLCVISDAQVIHLAYKPSGVVIVFPFHDSKLYTDTSAINYVCNHPADPEYENYPHQGTNVGADFIGKDSK